MTSVEVLDMENMLLVGRMCCIGTQVGLERLSRDAGILRAALSV